LRPVAGVDFTRRPAHHRKSITAAVGRRSRNVVKLEGLVSHGSFESFSQWLHTPGPWVAGLPRELVLSPWVVRSKAALDEASSIAQQGRDSRLLQRAFALHARREVSSPIGFAMSRRDRRRRWSGSIMAHAGRTLADRVGVHPRQFTNAMQCASHWRATRACSHESWATAATWSRNSGCGGPARRLDHAAHNAWGSNVFISVL